MADSTQGKSPTVQFFLKPIFDAEVDPNNDYRTNWARYEPELKAGKRNAGKDGQPKRKPERPPELQVIIDDSAMESIPKALFDNPAGIMWCRDGLNGLFNGLDRYSRGGKASGAKARLLAAYDSSQWKVNRADGGRNLLIPHATMSILGTIQPCTLIRTFDEQDESSGLLPRFILVRAEMNRAVGLGEWIINQQIDIPK